MRLCISSQLTTTQRIILTFRFDIFPILLFVASRIYVYEIFKILSCIEAVLV